MLDTISQEDVDKFKTKVCLCVTLGDGGWRRPCDGDKWTLRHGEHAVSGGVSSRPGVTDRWSPRLSSEPLEWCAADS